MGYAIDGDWGNKVIVDMTASDGVFTATYTATADCKMSLYFLNESDSSNRLYVNNQDGANFDVTLAAGDVATVTLKIAELDGKEDWDGGSTYKTSAGVYIETGAADAADAAADATDSTSGDMATVFVWIAIACAGLAGGVVASRKLAVR